MKTTKILQVTLVFFVFLTTEVYSQEEMELSAERIEKTQNFTDKVLLGTYYKRKQDYAFDKDVLSEELIKKYAVEVAFKLYPEAKNSKYSFAVKEDKSEKFWLAYVNISGALDGLITMIFVKKDGRLLYYSNHM